MQLEKMYQEYKDRVEFLLIYIREAHPSDQPRSRPGGGGRGSPRGGGGDAGGRPGTADGVSVKQPTTDEERRTVASECVKDLKLTMPTLIDEMGNGVGDAWAGNPDRLYVVDVEGKIAYQGAKGPKGFKPEEAEAAIRDLLEP